VRRLVKRTTLLQKGEKIRKEMSVPMKRCLHTVLCFSEKREEEEERGGGSERHYSVERGKKI
jgi:hypothetical protein